MLNLKRLRMNGRDGVFSTDKGAEVGNVARMIVRRPGGRLAKSSRPKPQTPRRNFPDN
jgi:hypothetical protein